VSSARFKRSADALGAAALVEEFARMMPSGNQRILVDNRDESSKSRNLLPMAQNYLPDRAD
jgi:hypothetical protein